MNPFDPGTAEYDAWERQDAGEGAQLLDDITAWISQYLSVPSDHFITVLALWVAHTHVTEAFYVTPRLVIDSAEPESGKTRVLELLNLLVRAPIFTMNTTIAALYRRLAQGPRTILIDEADAIFAKGAAQNHEDLRAVLNAGYKRGATVDRCETVGKEITVVEFPVFGPVVLAGIAGDMPDTITTRAVTLHMRRRAPGERIEEFIEEDAAAEAAPFRDRLTVWVADLADQLKKARPDMPEGVRDRKAEIWRSLLSLADIAGGRWPEDARAACRYFVVDTKADEMSIGTRLLSDLREVFADQERMFTAEVLNKLHAIEDAPWGESNGRFGPLDARRLAKHLGKYDVKSKSLKILGVVNRGYCREELVDLWRRYLPTAATAATNATEQLSPVAPIQQVADTSATGHTSATPLSREVAEVAAVADKCRGCGGPLDAVTLAEGFDTHPGCGT